MDQNCEIVVFDAKINNHAKGEAKKADVKHLFPIQGMIFFHGVLLFILTRVSAAVSREKEGWAVPYGDGNLHS